MSDERDRPEGERKQTEREVESSGEAVRRPVVDVSRTSTGSPPPRAPEPPRGAEPPSQPSTPRAGGGSGLKLAALAVVALLGYRLLTAGGHGKTDEPTQQYSTERAAHPGQSMVTLSPSDLAQDFGSRAQRAAAAGQPIPELKGASDRLLRAIGRGEAQFYQVRIYDDHDEDGDVVTVKLDNGVEYGPITLTNRGETLSIPVVGGVPPRITLYAVKDGYPSFGVTCGVHSSSGEWYSTILQPGQTQVVPFAAG